MARFGIDISNTGNATIKNETLRVDLPANLSHPDGNRLKIPLDPIAPGEVLQVAFQVRAEKAGPFLLSVDCEGQSHGRSGEVIAPVLQAEIDAPQRAIVREPIQGLVFLRNLGTAAAEQVQARLILPEGCEVLNNEESIYDSGRKELLWSLPLLEPKESLRLPFTIKAEVPGEGRLQLRVSASDASILSEHHLVFDFNPNLGARPLDQFLQSMADKMLPGQLPQLEKPASRKDATQATGSSFIVFSASRTLYAVSLASVIEVARARSITPVPNLPSWMLGISAIRGDMVSVLHLGSFFGQEGQSIPTEARVLVLNTQNKEVTVAVLVDRVRGLRTVEMEEIRPFPENLTHPVAEYALGVSEIEDQLVVLLDVDKLLLSPNLLQFQAA
jgi:purine-binding chemotaxis protein CheW